MQEGREAMTGTNFGPRDEGKGEFESENQPPPHLLLQCFGREPKFERRVLAVWRVVLAHETLWKLRRKLSVLAGNDAALRVHEREKPHVVELARQVLAHPTATQSQKGMLWWYQWLRIAVVVESRGCDCGG